MAVRGTYGAVLYWSFPAVPKAMLMSALERHRPGVDLWGAGDGAA
jgi:hypothetical protein